MKCSLPYGDRDYMLQLPDGQVKQVLEGKAMAGPASEEQAVRRALQNPVDSAPLAQIVTKGDKVCIIVGDVTRLWVRHHVLLPPILEELNQGGVPDRDILIISATGDHREQSPEEHRKLVGEDVYKRVQVIDHRAREDQELISLGTTAHGNQVRVNRKVAEADRVVLTGGIVYHFLAGWGGGKKAILPGVAGYNTIMKNHTLALHPEPGRGINPEVRAAKIEGNPCSDDMVQGASLVGPDFLVNSVINEADHKIALVTAGNYLSAHQKGCSFVDRHMKVQINESAPLVIASCGGYPKDINFYQTYKTIYHAHFALQKGGTMILLSESREGMGSADFASIFTSFPNNAAREAELRRRFTIGGFMGYHTAVIAEENRVLALTDLNRELVRSMGMIPVSSLDEALETGARDYGGEIPPAYVIPHGGTTLPFLQ